MSLLSLAMAYVRHRRLVTGVTVICLALGVALILVVLNVRRQVEREFLRQAQDYDLIVGSHGSDVGLVLTALFHADQPRSNIPYALYEQIRDQRGVVAAYPFGLGDRYRGSIIVGTTREFLEQKNATGQPVFPLAQGRLFDKDFELVLGASAARYHGLQLGAHVVSTHGAAADAKPHNERPYTVVGILAATGSAQDRGMFTSLASYWEIHGQHAEHREPQGNSPQLTGTEPEVTVVLLRTAKPLVFQLARLLPRKFGVMVVRPTDMLQRMFAQVLRPMEQILLLYSYAVVLVAAASILTTLYLSTLVRRHDLAVLRAIGATPGEVFTVVLLEALVLLVIGCSAGVLLSQLIGSSLRERVFLTFGLKMELFRFTPAELAALAGVCAIGLLAAVLPAWQAYRGDVAGNLGHNG